MADNAAPPEADLIEEARKRNTPPIPVREAARRAGISESYWRMIAKGYNQASKDVRVPVRAPDDTLARMAHAVGVTPHQLAEVDRRDAALGLERMLEADEVEAIAQGAPTFEESVRAIAEANVSIRNSLTGTLHYAESLLDLAEKDPAAFLAVEPDRAPFDVVDGILQSVVAGVGTLFSADHPGYLEIMTRLLAAAGRLAVLKHENALGG